MNVLFNISGDIKQYSCDATRVRNHFLSLPLDDELWQYHQALALVANAPVGNNVVYRISHEGNFVYVGFYDLCVTFGWSIDE